EKLLVDAGPGTGKTYVACARVAHLIREGITPARIWIVSFTRTAVHEIRSRLAASLDDPASAAGVQIATLDSHAWAIQSGFTKDASITGSHDDNIEATIRKIDSDEGAQNYLGRVRHLIIDEAQDIVSQRADLVMTLIAHLHEDCGVTVFADRAQAIYGFTEDDARAVKKGETLLEKLAGRSFKPAALRRVHRTSRPGLLRIFTDIRQQVLDDVVPAATRGPDVRAQILQHADGDIGPVKTLDLSTLPADSLVLMRQRCDVLLASSFGNATPHRLRMSGLPARIWPWLGEVFWDYTEPRITRDEFGLRWNDIVRWAGTKSADDAWALLVEAAGINTAVVDVNRLRDVLGRSSPPAIFASPEYGDTGPVLGTIHASKGREADEVRLYLPPEHYGENDNDDDEEIRVMFVGATRARNRLTVGSTGERRSGTHDEINLRKDEAWRLADLDKRVERSFLHRKVQENFSSRFRDRSVELSATGRVRSRA
ncbi:MAG: hypothetical protein EOO81_08235, partial [Oxalobacteraceae bacterium]